MGVKFYFILLIASLVLTHGANDICITDNADVGFMLDAVGSSNEAARLQQFIKSMINTSFELGPENVRTALFTILPSKNPMKILSLNDPLTSDVLDFYINKIILYPYLPDTSTFRALYFLESVVLYPANLANRTNGTNTRKIAVLITTQKTSDLCGDVKAATSIKNKGTELYVIGVGAGVDVLELQAMATAPAEEHTFVLNTFYDLVPFTSNFSKALCSGGTVISTAAPDTSDWYRHYQSKCAEPTTIQTTSSGSDTTVSSGHEITSVSSQDNTDSTIGTKTNPSDVSDITVSSGNIITSVSVKFGTPQDHTSPSVTSLTVPLRETKTNPTEILFSKAPPRMPNKKGIGTTPVAAEQEKATKENLSGQSNGVDGMMIGIIAGVASAVVIGGVAGLTIYLKKSPQSVRPSMLENQMEEKHKSEEKQKADSMVDVSI